MFDWPLDWFSLVIAVGAFILALKAFTRTDSLQARLNALESAQATAAARSITPPMPPPLPPLQEIEATLAAASPGPTTEQPGTFAEDAATTVAAEAPPAPDAATTGAAPPPLHPPLLPAEPGFEERIGTRWVVWIGGLTLALGGFFLVRYSIEAGLLGPGVRTMLGGLFALALLGAGEWTRRRQDIAEIEALPIANIPAIVTAAGTAVAFATVYAAYALYDFLAPATAFILLGLVALGTLAAALLHGPALAGLGVAAAFVTPVLVSSDQPDYWALYIYLAIVTAAAFALARIRLWRWLAITTIVFALLWTMPCLDCGPSMIAPHLFHVIAGFVLAALLVVTAFAFGPAAGEERVELISSGALAAYLFGATLIVLFGHHADSAIIAFALLIAGAVFVAWRAPAAAGVLGASSLLIFAVFVEWVVRASPDWLVVPGGALPSIGGPAATDGSVSLHLVTAAIFAVGFGVTGFLAQGRFSAANITVRWAACGRLHAARALGRALRAHRASRPLDPVRNSGRAARRGLRGRDRNADAPRREARPADCRRAVCDRHARRAGAGADLLARKGLALNRAGADVDGHRLDFSAAADTVHANARRDPRRNRDRADRLRAAHRGRRRRHHADLQLAALGLWHSGIVVLGRAATSCAAAATTHRCARWSRPRSCSRCCWCSWKFVMPSMAATSTATMPASPRLRCRCRWRWPWRSASSACASAAAASFTTSAPCC